MSQMQVAGFNTIGAIDQWMKTIASNVTGSTVTGFKGSDVQFGQVLEMMTTGAVKPTDGYGSQNPVQHADSGIMVKSVTTDFTQGNIQQTGNPTNLAISGDAFFVLSRSPVPNSMDEVTFTRDGNFHFEYLKGDINGTGTYRLVNSDGLFVMGYNAPIDPATRPPGTPPNESQGTDLGAFSTVAPNGAGQPVSLNLQNIQVDQVRNPDATGNFSFDSQGGLRINGEQPHDLADNPANMHVALAKFANNQGLRRDSGGAYFKYDVVAGQIFSGTAATQNDATRVVGKNNNIQSGALENANTSINTTMPLITLAQKSFSAASKLVSVGNTLIDDVNQLVK